jgi:hypothetical protein
VRAVLTRAEHRLRTLLVEIIDDDAERQRPDLVHRLLPPIGAFFREHRGSLAVLQRGPVDGDDPGAPLCHVFGDLLAEVIDTRVPGISPVERDVMANTMMRIIVSVLAEYVRDDDPQAERYLDELGYVVSAYLHCRHPQVFDPPTAVGSWVQRVDPTIE